MRPARKTCMQLILFIGFFWLGLTACQAPVSKQDRINWQPRLSEKGSDPYDCRLSREALSFYFPRASIRTLNKDFRYTNMGSAMYETDADSAALLILAGLDFYIGEQEWASLKYFIAQGHEVLLFCSRLDERLEQELGLRKHISMEGEALNNYYTGRENKDILYLSNRAGAYGYQGRSLEGFFQMETETPPADSSDEYLFGRPQILGTRRQDVEVPNVLRFPLGDGHLTLHAAPLVLSNYFLLQKNNRDYLDGLLHTLPADINRVYWQSYLRRQRQGNELSVLWRNTATRWAILLAIATLLLYVLFEMKRRQRIIPEILRPENHSVQFATTIGQLYYHQGNHRNMGLKMWQHFQDWLRVTHNLETPATPDPAYARRLGGKTGQTDAAVKALLYLVRLLHDENFYFSEQELRQFYGMLQSFYGHKPATFTQPPPSE